MQKSRPYGYIICIGYRFYIGLVTDRRSLTAKKRMKVIRFRVVILSSKNIYILFFMFLS